MFKVKHRSFAIILVLIGIAEICQYNHVLQSQSTANIKDITGTELTNVRPTKYSNQRVAPYNSEYFDEQRALYAITGDYLQTDFAPALRQDIVSQGVQSLMHARDKNINPTIFPYAIFGEQVYHINNSFGRPRYDFILSKVLGVGAPKIRLTNNVNIAKSATEAYKLTKTTNIFAKPVITINRCNLYNNAYKQPAVPLYTITNTYFTNNQHKFLINNFNDVPMWLIYADANNPNWHAYIDNSPTEIYPANLAFKAIQVPPGSHEVYFKFTKTITIHKMFFVMQIIIGFMLACLILSYPFIAKYFKPRDINE